MDRSTAVKLWREIGLGIPEGGATGRIVELFATAVEAAERERLLSKQNLMRACDHLGAPIDDTHCDILLQALHRD